MQLQIKLKNTGIFSPIKNTPGIPRISKNMKFGIQNYSGDKGLGGKNIISVMRFLPTERNRLIMWRKESTLIKDSVMESDSVKNMLQKCRILGTFLLFGDPDS